MLADMFVNPLISKFLLKCSLLGAVQKSNEENIFLQKDKITRILIIHKVDL